MLKMPLGDFIEEVKAEIMSYEELGEEKAGEWEDKFVSLIEKNALPKKFVKREQNKTVVALQDESELFTLTDSYWAAVVNDEEDKYWDGLTS